MRLLSLNVLELGPLPVLVGIDSGGLVQERPHVVDSHF